jgi:RHS repeat-associated protein
MNRVALLCFLTLSVIVHAQQYNSSNQLTSTPDATYTYDNNGNVLTKTDASGTTTYNWDFEDRLSSVVLPGSGGTISYRYDPMGRRIQKISPTGTVNYIYDGANIVEELDASGNVLAKYTQGQGVDEPLAVTRSGSTSYYQADGLGSITSLTNSSGAIVGTYTYDSFGNQTTSTGTVVNPFRYTGREFDTETGNYFYRARYYDPTTGRFLSEDPDGFAAGINFYPYAENNPLRFRDPSGRNPAIALPWLAPAGEGVLAVICFGSGACETVVVVGGVAAGVGAISYLAYDYFRNPRAKPRPNSEAPKCEEKRQRNCAQEWAEARAACAVLLAQPNPPRGLTGGYTSVEACARGLVSEACGGNPIDWGTPR